MRYSNYFFAILGFRVFRFTALPFLFFLYLLKKTKEKRKKKPGGREATAARSASDTTPVISDRFLNSVSL